jgi:hypothetical protein
MTSLDFETDRQWGPAMAALTPKQRNYVLAMASDPFGNPTQWARLAGYSDVKEGAKVRGHELSHDPNVDAAVKELSKTALGTLGPFLAAAGLLRIARKPDHPDHFKSLLAIANRVGMNETTEHTVKVEHTDLRGDALLERIRALAVRLGVDETKLIGGNAMIESTATEVKNV